MTSVNADTGTITNLTTSTLTSSTITSTTDSSVTYNTQTVIIGSGDFSFDAAALTAANNSTIDLIAAQGDTLDEDSPVGSPSTESLAVAAQLGFDGNTANVVTTGNAITSVGNTVISSVGDCSWISDPSSAPSTFTPDFQLTDLYALGYLTTYVTFPHTVVANKGLSAAQIVCNLKLLALNCWTPIKQQYPNAYITCSFRPGATEKQHGDGAAMDIQFTGASKADYFNIASWINDNVLFDRLLLEYKTSGTGLPWIHISYTTTPERLVFTFFNDIKYATGLVDLSKN
jgi:hypothetical protein